jgi:prepilin-type N-terminal cleavage/methylation domain-containing protein
VTLRSIRIRRGYTLIELLLVLAILILFAVIVLPSSNTFFGGNRAKAAADTIRSELAAARAWASEDGVPYRVALSADGTKIRRAPETEFNEPATENGPAAARRAEHTFEKVVAEVVVGDDGTAATATEGGWVTIAVVLPDGTCRDDREEAEDNGNEIVIVAVRERPHADKPPNDAGIHVVIRGITGHVRVVTGGLAAAQSQAQGQRP